MYLPTLMSQTHAKKPLTMIVGTAFRHRISAAATTPTAVRLYWYRRPPAPCHGLQKKFLSTAKNFRNQPQRQSGQSSQRQFQLFPGPRRVRYNLSNNARTAGGRGRGRGNGASSSSTTGQIPTYFYYMGGMSQTAARYYLWL